jgi:N-methylhydantoinase B
VIYAIRCFLDPTIPMNEGCFRAIDIRLPDRSLVNPTRPHPAGGRYVTVSAGVEAIYQAMSQAQPSQAVAASGLIHPFSIAGPSTSPWLHMAFDFGGMGARWGKDGPDATGGLFGGGRNLVPQAEAIEARLPVVIEAMEVIPDSGGAGRWRGGRATRTTIRLLADAVVDTRADRISIPPGGVLGGRPGRPGGFFRLEPDGRRTPVAAKAAGVPFRAGEALVVETSGGGGLGAPSLRDPALVARDLASGCITPEGLRRDYGLDQTDQ